ncbi:MAG: YbgC/FadM family acyl-CoA thioesterase [Myxococcales bacterium]|nr:YbgC/FadM family acyl-CoA thioesterase [Myxococcales bacterium]
MPAERFECKVYLEDTDAQGIVYHANYLRFLERARTEYLESLGLRQRERMSDEVLFVVHEVHAKFLKPARAGERLEVATRAERASDYRLRFVQDIRRAGEPASLVTAEVFVVCVGREGELVEIPASVRL